MLLFVVLACGRRNDECVGLSSGGSVLSRAGWRLLLASPRRSPRAAFVASSTLGHRCRPLLDAEPATLLMDAVRHVYFLACASAGDECGFEISVMRTSKKTTHWHVLQEVPDPSRPKS